MVIELRLEHYLCDNIKVDLKNKNDLFENIDDYFNNECQNDQKLKLVIEKLKNIAEDSKINILHIRKLMFGQKLIIWNYLRNSIFKNKFLGINKEEEKYLVTSLNNIRLMRNGIAHLDSKEQIFKKLRQIDSNKRMNKKELYKESFKIANKMQTIKKQKKENANE